jgi:hypothetical protein
MSAPIDHFKVQNRSVFIFWKPQHERKKHDISVLSSGDLDVTCYCEKLDKDMIRKQVEIVIAQKEKIKKND